MYMYNVLYHMIVSSHLRLEQQQRFTTSLSYLMPLAVFCEPFTFYWKAVPGIT